MGQKHYTLKDDLMFKLIFGDSANKHLLKEFLQDILDLKIKSLDILNPYNIRSVIDSKTDKRLVYTAVDIVTKIQNGISIIVELQIQSKNHFPERLLYYWGERFNANYAKTEKKESKYRSLKPVFIVSILDYIMFPDDQDLRRTFHIYDTEHHQIFQNKKQMPYIKVTFIELPKITGNVPLNLIDWIACFEFSHVDKQAKAPIREVIRLVNKKNEAMEVEIMRTFIERAQEDAKAELEYAVEKSEHIGIEKGKIIGHRVGQEEGHEKGLEEAALNLKKIGMPLEQIRKTTGLTISRISQL